MGGQGVGKGNSSSSGRAEIAHWRTRLFGSLVVERNGRRATFRTRKTASVFAYLAYYVGQPVSKDVLTASFWPESNNEKGRHSLRMALSSIRSALAAPDWNPDSFIRSDRDAIEFSEKGFSTDVVEFRNWKLSVDGASDPSENAKALKEAVDLYAGPLLSNFGDDWILPQSLEMEEAFAQAVGRLVEETVRLGGLPQAVATCRRALAIHPHREDLYVALIRAYSYSGEPSAAIKLFEELECMLDEIWGEQPGAEAKAALEAMSPTAVSSATNATLGYSHRSFSRSPFFGREDELAELRELLEPVLGTARLVTLVGLGGAGKTRIAEKTATDMSDAFRGRVWYSSLVGAQSADQMMESIISSLDLKVEEPHGIVDAVASVLSGPPSLLVVDNVEQIALPAAKVAEELILRCPMLRILATSRVPLDSPFERIYAVPPFPLPATPMDVQGLRASPCVQLLVEAAQSVRPGFNVTPTNAQSVAMLCRHVEGIPLALELAAAKLAAMTPAQVMASIRRRSDLSTIRADVRDRHRRLDEVIKWSYGLLDPNDREAFVMLGVCRGGFEGELAAEIVGPTSEAAVLALCRCSLASWKESADEVRFEMLETVREVAVELLAGSANCERTARMRHFDFCLRLCEMSGPAQRGDDLEYWLKRVHTEIENIHAAVESAILGYASAKEAWRLLLAVRPFWERRGHTQVWIVPLERLIKATEERVDHALRSKAYGLLARAHYGTRDILASHRYARAAIVAADLSGDPFLRVDSRSRFATTASILGEFDEALGELKVAVPLLEAVQDLAESERCYTKMGWIVFDRGQEPESEKWFRLALDHAERSQEAYAVSEALTGLACAVGHNRYDEAQAHFDRAHTLRRQLGQPEALAHGYFYRSLTDYRHGRLCEAASNLKQSFGIYVENGISLGQTPLTIGGNILSALDRFDEAAACWGKAEAARLRHGMKTLPNLLADAARELERAVGAIGADNVSCANHRGSAMSDADILELVMRATSD